MIFILILDKNQRSWFFHWGFGWIFSKWLWIALVRARNQTASWTPWDFRKWLLLFLSDLLVRKRSVN